MRTQPPAINPRQHGTTAGYWQHYRAKEAICGPCREAHRQYQRALRSEKAEQYRENDRQRAAKTRAAATRGNRAWTPDEDAVVANGPGTFPEKGLQLGRSEKAVKHRAAYLRNPPPPKPPRVIPQCSVTGCEKGGKRVRGMCAMHYARWQKYGTPEPHGLTRLGCDCAVCVQARERHAGELREKRRRSDAQRKRSAEHRRRERRRLREKYQSDADYRRMVLERCRQQRDKRIREDPSCEAQYTRRWKRENPEKARSLQKRMTERHTALNRQSRVEAHNNGKEWTGPELEVVALHDDMTAMQLAKFLGRTVASVTHARRKLREEPREIALAGVPAKRGLR